jgi:hypothetical protein
MNINVHQLDSILQERLSPELVQLKQRIQRTLLGPVAPNGITSFAIRKYRKFEDLRCLAVLVYYLEEEYGVLLRLDLESAISHLAYPQAVELASMLSSKEEMLDNLIFGKSDRDFFGNFLPRVKSVAGNLQFLTRYPNRAVEKVRRRGYRDHGSCRPESRWLPSFDWSFTEVQNRLEESKTFRNRILSNVLKEGATKWILNYHERVTIYD